MDKDYDLDAEFVCKISAKITLNSEFVCWSIRIPILYETKTQNVSEFAYCVSYKRRFSK